VRLVSSTARTTINMPAIKPKIDQEICPPMALKVICFQDSAPIRSRKAPPSATRESGNYVADAMMYARATRRSVVHV